MRDFGAFEVVEQRGRTSNSVAILESARRLATGFVRIGLRTGDRVLTVLPNGAWHLVTNFALWRAGLVVAPLHVRSVSREIARIAGGIDARAVVTTAALLDTVVDAFRGVASPPRIIVWPETEGHVVISAEGGLEIVSTDVLSAGCEPMLDVRKSDDDLALLLFTGGTTGRPKGVMLTHANVWHAVHTMPNRDKRYTALALFPMNHIAGITYPLMHTRFGFRTVLSDVGPADVLGAIERTRADYIVGVPSTYIAMLVYPEATRFDTSSAKIWMYGGASLPEEQAKAIERRFGCSVHVAWGLTETSAPNTFTELAGRRKPGSCGRPSEGNLLRIVGPEGRDRPVGERGEVWASGPQIVSGYLGMPEETKQVLTDGWLHTGDLGWLDGDGDLFLVGRSKDIIIRGGENVYPEEVESVIAGHPAIVTCAVVGLPNDLLGEEVVAFVVVNHGDRERVIDEVRRLCGDNMTAYKVPRFEVLDEMPKTPIGKIDRVRLRALGRELLATSRETPTRSRIRRAPEHRRRALMISVVLRVISEILKVSRAELDQTMGFIDLGLASAQAIELAFALGTELGLQLPGTLAFQVPTAEALADELLTLLGGSVQEPAPRPRAPRTEEPIAIVGMGFRMPGGVVDDESLWRVLQAGLDTAGAMPTWRWNDEPHRGGHRGNFIDDIEMFDPGFFGITSGEAREMDPQQRVLLEVCWGALENAGVAPATLAGSLTGVYVGMGTMDYFYDHTRDGGVNALSGGLLSVAAGRISHVLGLRGPNLVVDTACSASLTATHLAIRALRGGECEVALAGGVGLCLSPQYFSMFGDGGVLSAEARCKTFDASADGIGRSEGCGIVVLMRLSDALARGHTIRALLRGSAINHDGFSSSLTAPNGGAQEAVIRAALDDAGLAPADVTVIEAHGTGTPTGDPIEVAALVRVFGPGTTRPERMYLSSLKAIVGHMEVSAGVGGLVRSVLALERREITPMAQLHTLNPLLQLEVAGATIPTESIPWRSQRRIIGVSSFGMSGTNAHAILEEAPPRSPPEATGSRPVHVLPISAKTPAALARLVTRYQRHLAAYPSLRVEDVCFTAGAGRNHFDHRVAIVASSGSALRAEVSAAAAAENRATILRGQRRANRPGGTAVLFSGAASLRPKLGKALYDGEPAYRAAIDECAGYLSKDLERPLQQVMFSDDGKELADRPAWILPALFATEWALYRLWASWGIAVDAVMGHSFGEYAAATAAGVFSIEDACKLVAARGRLMEVLTTGGAMVAMEASEGEVVEVIADHAGRISLAAINGPMQVVVSGEVAPVEEVAAVFAARGRKTRRLMVSHAGHSALMDPMLEPFRQVAQTVRYHAPSIPIASNVTGTLLDDTFVADADYWVAHLRGTVRFHQGMTAIAALGCTSFIEAGPDPVLLGLAAGFLADPDLVWLPSLRRGEAEWDTLASSVASYYAHGGELDWQAFTARSAGRRIPLPTYAFERRRCWIARSGRARSGSTVDLEDQNLEPRDADRSGAIRRELGALAIPERIERLRVLLRGELEEMLGVGLVRDDTRLVQLGIDSLRAIELRNNLNQRFGLSLLLTELAVAGTVDALALRLAGEFDHVERSVDVERIAPAATISSTDEPDFDRTGTIEVGSLRLSVLEWGSASAPPLVCVHGLLDQALAWRPLARLLGRQGFRVVALDLPGHGCSDHIAGTAGYPVTEAMRAIDAVMKHVGPCVLLGHSLGGIYAFGVAAGTSASLRGLVLIDPPVAMSVATMTSSHANPATLRDALASGALPRHVIFSSEAQAAHLMQESLPVGTPAALVLALTQRVLREVPGGFSWRSDPRIKLPPTGTVLVDLLLQGVPISQTLAVLGIFARPGVSEPRDREPVQIAFPRARVVDVDTGHWPHLEAPEVLAELIAGFVRTLP
ncbi:MAG: alpha/beta fold hydrolase [Proteobacteria bacterium]|nr:alpha/beta fold hydrolase [Pseudomonadota bacterium]